MKSVVFVFSLFAITAAQAETAGSKDLASRNICSDKNHCVGDTWSLIAGAGYATTRFDNDDVALAAGQLGFDVYDIETSTDRFAWKVNLGMSLSERWTAEVGYADMGEVKTAFTTTTAAPEAFFALAKDIHPRTVDGWTVGLDVQFWRFEESYFYARAGLYLWDAEFESQRVFESETIERDDNAEGVDAYYGLGYRYEINDDWQVGIEWEKYNYDSSDASVFMLNLMMKL